MVNGCGIDQIMKDIVNSAQSTAFGKDHEFADIQTHAKIMSPYVTMRHCLLMKEY